MEKNNKENYHSKDNEDNITELEQKELEKLGSFLDDEDNQLMNDIDKENNTNQKMQNKNILIFKSTDFNDFPESSPNNIIKKSHKKEFDIKINKDINNYENNKIEEKKDNNNNIYDIEEDNNENVEDDIVKDDDLDNEINLEEQLKKEYEGGEFTDKEKMNNEDISDNELMSMPKENIIQYKNYQILKLKTIIKTLRQEKESLMDNYKKTTDNLLQHIKELEFKGTGERPMTAKIIHKIASSNDIEKTAEDHNNKERCPNCGKIIKTNIMEHSLECIRKKYKCVYCNELMNIEEKTKHNESFYNKDKLYDSIINKNIDYIIKVLKHNFPINDIILDDKTGDYFIHLIIKYNIFNVIKKCEKTINVNLENKNKETPLFLAISNEYINVVKELIYRGADINKRNKSDLSPLMLCCKNNYQNIAELLIKKGANVNEKNILGDTPVKIAQLNGNEELALKLIKLYKAEIN
jgi:hypothetical protein